MKQKRRGQYPNNTPQKCVHCGHTTSQLSAGVTGHRRTPKTAGHNLARAQPPPQRPRPGKAVRRKTGSRRGATDKFSTRTSGCACVLIFAQEQAPVAVTVVQVRQLSYRRYHVLACPYRTDIWSTGLSGQSIGQLLGCPGGEAAGVPCPPGRPGRA